MPSRLLAPIVLVALLAFGACPSPSGDPGDGGGPTTAPPLRGSAEPQVPNRPAAGDYVYDLTGLGATADRVPEGAQLTERVSVSGDIYTIDISNNQNPNTRSIRLRWEPDAIVLLSTQTLIRGSRSSCTYNPPVELIRIPIQQEDFEDQETTGCSETTQITVLGTEDIQDADGRGWTTWVIVAQTLGNGRTDEETRWFSAEVGRYIRVDTATDTSEGRTETSQLLRSYPSA